ncbi:MAG TPA: ATP-binding protein [Stenomitos sp.]
MASLLLWGLVTVSVVRQVGQPFPGFRSELTLSVSPQNLGTWNGPQHGLASYDRLLSANGHPLVTTADLDRLVRSVPPGTPLTYELLRKGVRQRVTVPTQTLTWPDVGRGFAPTLLIALFQLLIGAIAFWLKPTHPATQAHLLLATSIGLGFQTLGIDYTWAHQFCLLYTATVNFLAAAGLHLAFVFPAPIRLLRERPWIAALFYLPAVALSVIALMSYQAVGEIAHIPPQGIFAHYLELWALWTVLGFAVLLIRAAFVAFRAPRPLARAQGRMLIAGATLAYLPGIVAYVVPAGLHKTAELSMATIMGVYMCFVLFPLAVAYAILRHQLFAINLVLKRTATYSMLGLALFALYVTSSSVAQRLLGASHPGITTAVLLVGLIPLRNASLYVMDRYFFRQPYSFQDVVTRFAEASMNLREPERLMALYFEVIETTLSPSYGGIFLRDTASGRYVQYASFGLEAEALEPLKECLESQADGLAGGAFGERRYGDRWPGTVVVGSLAVQQDPVGVVVVGERKSDLEYGPQDRQLLVNLSHQLGLTLKNASLFAEAIQRNQQLEAMNRSLLEVDQLKRDFLNATSHELRTPLASIIGYAEFLEDRIGGELSEDQAFFVSQIQDGSRRLKRLVEDLLDFTRLEAGSLQLTMREADLGLLIRQVLQALQPQLSAGRLQVETQLPEAPVIESVDPDRIEQVLFNLVGNALKFTPEDGTVRVSLTLEGAVVRVAVEDTGIGIAPEHLPHLFDKFYQVDPSSTRRFGGLGLGLSISKSIIEAHHGTFQVTSSLTSGSCFAFTLPRTSSAAGMPGPERADEGVGTAL